MAEISLVAETGRITGSRSSSRLRNEGKIPAVVYGSGGEPLSVAVDWRELRAALTTDAGLNALIRLEVDGSKKLTIVTDMQRHPVKRNVLHIDFLEIDPNKPIDVQVPIHLTGEAKAVLDENGVVEQIMFSLHVKARPDSIPTGFTVDVTDLTLDEAITADSIELPDGVELAVDGHDPVVSGQITRSTIEAIEAEEAAEAAAEEAEEIAEGEAAEGGDAAGSDEGGDSSEGGDDA